MTFQVVLKNSTEVFSTEFRPMLVSAIEDGKKAILNPYDEVVIFLSSIVKYEDENGEWVTVTTV